MVWVMLLVACGADGKGDSGGSETDTPYVTDTDTDSDADTDTDTDTDSDTDADTDSDTDTDADTDTDTDTDTDRTEPVLTVGPAERIDPVGAGQSRLALAPALDGGWWAAWDDNDVAVEAAYLGQPAFHVDDTSLSGVGTPRIVGGVDRGVLVYRFGPVTRVAAFEPDGTADGLLVGASGDSQPLSGWSTPRIARRDDGTLAAVWWTGNEPIGNEATYWFRRYSAELEPIGGPVVIGGSDGSGSPANLIATAEGWVVAWSERTGFADLAVGEIRVRRLGPDGTPLAAAVRVDIGDLDRPAERPVLAAVDDGYVVGWRGQTFEQVGVGVRARHLDATLEPLGEPYALGGATANRLNLAAVGEVVLFQWESADDVLWQLGHPDGTPLTDPVSASDDPSGRQAGGAVAAQPGSWPARFQLGWEEGPFEGAVVTGRELTWGP